jgi:hypothetical protein
VARACPNVLITTGTKSAVPNEIYVKQYQYWWPTPNYKTNPQELIW